MSRSTLALAYATRAAQAAAPQPVASAQPRRAPPARLPAALPPAAAHALPRTRATPAAIAEDALLIAVRRSLASCRDSSQLRMLAAFERSM